MPCGCYTCSTQNCLLLGGKTCQATAALPDIKYLTRLDQKINHASDLEYHKLLSHLKQVMDIVRVEKGVKKGQAMHCSQVNSIWLACTRNVFKHWFGYEFSCCSIFSVTWLTNL